MIKPSYQNINKSFQDFFKKTERTKAGLRAKRQAVIDEIEKYNIKL